MASGTGVSGIPEVLALLAFENESQAERKGVGEEELESRKERRTGKGHRGERLRERKREGEEEGGRGGGERI